MKHASLSGVTAGRQEWRAGRRFDDAVVLQRALGTARRRRPRAGRLDAGEVFIEALVAAAVVSMIMVGMFRVVTDAAMHARMTEQRRVALLIAKSELSAVGSQIPITAGENSGFSGDMAWTIDISPYSDETGASSVGALWAVDVSVRPRLERRALVRLRTLRLGPEA